MHKKQTDRQTLPSVPGSFTLRFADSSARRQKGKRKREQKQTERRWKVHVFLLGLVEDIYLLQKQAVIQGHRGGLGQNLEDNPWLSPNEHHCVVLVRSCFIVHSKRCQSVPSHTAERHVLLTVGVSIQNGRGHFEYINHFGSWVTKSQTY